MVSASLNNLNILMLFFGFILATSLYSLMLYYWGRIVTSLYYCIFAIGIGIFAGLLGGIPEYFSITLSDSSVYWSREITSTIFSIAYLQFGRTFLNTQKLYPRTDKFCLLTMALLVLLPNYYSGSWVLLSISVNLLYASSGLVLAYCAWCEYLKGKIYVLFMMVSTLLIAFTFYGDAIFYASAVSAGEFFNEEQMTGGRLLILCGISMLEMLLFSISIAGLFRYTQQQHELAELSGKIRLRFFSAASHDIRQPLYALRSFNTALSQTEDPEIVESISRKIGSTVDTMIQLFDSLLVSTRLEAGVEEVHAREFLLSSMFKRLENEFSLLAERENIELIFSWEETPIRTDQLLLERILRNLLTNALAHMDKKEGGRVELILSRRNDKFNFAVKDNGPGMDKNQQQRVFQEFSRSSNAHQLSSPGSGLGLFIIKQTASLINATVSVESEQGFGSCFSVELSELEIA